MKLGKILEAKNPLSGQSVNLTDVGAIWSLILGGVLLFFVTATSQNVAKMISEKVPALDTSVQPLTSSPVKIQGGKIQI